jgi:hypothetical protein
MARPKLEQPNYRLVRRGSRYYVRWWTDGAWQRVSTGTDDRRQAQIFLAQFLAGQGTPAPQKSPTVSVILDAYLIDGKPTVVPRGYETLETNLKALKRHLGDLEPDHLTKERIRFYRRQRTSDLRLHVAHHPADGPGRWSHRLGLRTGRGAAPVHGPRRHHRPRWEDRRPQSLPRLAAGLKRIRTTHAINMLGCD